MAARHSPLLSFHTTKPVPKMVTGLGVSVSRYETGATGYQARRQWNSGGLGSGAASDSGSRAASVVSVPAQQLNVYFLRACYASRGRDRLHSLVC